MVPADAMRESQCFAAEDFAAVETNPVKKSILSDYATMYRELRALRREVKRLQEVEDRYADALWADR